ncbi:unnamed protein product [Orchesella dallaii]|uniref:Crossover junction endonuclease MUS81 n=1 Tax=Orchesella dallaii TaxID=48710 RepID=A0ABP1QZQ9_9HEXA
MSQRWRGGFSQRSKAAPKSKKPCPNPIFESWIIEWKEEAETKDSKMKYVYAKALNSLRKYPLPLSSGKECSILENFGSHMCKMIENRMAKENMFPEDLQSAASQGILDVITVGDEEPGPSSKITANKKKQRTTSVKKKIPVPNVDQEGLNDQLEIPEPQPSTSRKITTPKKKAKPIVKLPSHVEVVDLLGSDSESEPQPLSSYRVTAPKKKKKAGPTPAEVRIPIPGFDAQDFIETDTECEPEPTTSTKAVKQKGKQYLPAYRSGAYAILMALLKKECDADYRGYMTKSELQQDAQRYCDMSLTKPDSTKHSHYTAWNSMKILTNKELVMKRGNPVLFFLSPEGRSLARKLLDAESKDSQLQPPSGGVNAVTDYELSSQDEEDCEVVSPNLPTNIHLEPGKFEIVLYVDTCETNGKGKSQDVINELQKNGVTIYVHRLNIGDFVWVCREVADVSGNRNRLTMSRTNELILPYVVERKRTDDLAHSIRDGRFHEQKYRLTQTQLQPIYLIESYGKGDWGLAEGALDRAIANTQIENGFLIQETSSIKDTCAYLTFMTRHLKDTYEHKTILGCRKDDWTNLRGVSTNTEAYMMLFSDFNDFSVKKTNWKVKEMFARHLMRLKGLSVDKAYAIIQKYPTLDDLLKTYSKCETLKEKESLLSQVEFGTSCRKIGPSISRKVSRFYNSTNLS